jgi:hypothetical protein
LRRRLGWSGLGLSAPLQHNREVTAALFVSPKTVEFHLAGVYWKLDIRSRAQLGRRLREPNDFPRGTPSYPVPPMAINVARSDLWLTAGRFRSMRDGGS